MTPTHTWPDALHPYLAVHDNAVFQMNVNTFPGLTDAEVWAVDRESVIDAGYCLDAPEVVLDGTKSCGALVVHEIVSIR